MKHATQSKLSNLNVIIVTLFSSTVHLSYPCFLTWEIDVTLKIAEHTHTTNFQWDGPARIGSPALVQMWFTLSVAIFLDSPEKTSTIPEEAPPNFKKKVELFYTTRIYWNVMNVLISFEKGTRELITLHPKFSVYMSQLFSRKCLLSRTFTERHCRKVNSCNAKGFLRD